MEIYKLDFDLNDHAALLSVNERDLDRFEPFDGSPMAPIWQPVRMLWETEGGKYPLSDVTAVSVAPAFSARALEVLGDLLAGRGELLPLEVRDGDEHYVFNTTRLSDALDEEHSECDYFNDGRIMGIDRYEFDRTRLAGETIFKLRQDPLTHVYVTDEFRQRVETAGLTGLSWQEPVWSGPCPARS